MRKFTFLIIFSLIIGQAFSQAEANFWYFGENAGVSFAAGDPVGKLDGSLNTWEGCSSISTENGALRFYTDGITVYNRDHDVMPNGYGLLGDPSSSQSGIIVPKPGDNQKYYIFTIDDVDVTGGAMGLNYSLVDMTLEGFKGDIVDGQKNINLTKPLCEKVTAVGHSNGFDTWVITQKWGSNDFYVYLITNDGIDTEPVISSAGSVISGGIDNAKGYMKVSPDGTRLAKGNAGLRTVEFFDFDNSTGVVSNAFMDASLGGEPYGIEFSPNNRFLYVNTWKSNPGQVLYQYDLEAGSPSDVVDSRKTIAGGANGALQLGPDNRIYVATAGGGYLGRINFPNNLGSACNYEAGAVYLEGRQCMWGLPPFVQSFFSFNAGFNNDPPCFGTPTQFFENSSTEPDSVFWDFGNPASGPENYSTEFDPEHLFTSPGLYNVKLKVWIEGHEDIASKFFNVALPPEVDLGEDTFFCEGDTYVIDAGEGYESYLWNTGDTTQTLAVQTAGTYWVEVYNDANCNAIDTLKLNAYPKPEIDLGNDLEFCEGELYELDAGPGFESYLWSTGDTTQTLVIQSTGDYWVTVTNVEGCPNTDTLKAVFNPRPVADAGPTQNIDQGTTTVLEGSATGGTGTLYYHWEPANLLEQNNIPNPTTKPLVDPTLFTLVVTDDKGCESQSDQVLININGSDMTAFPLADPATICQGEETYVTANAAGGGGEYTYQWTSNPSGFTSNQASFTVSPQVTTTYNLVLKDQFDNQITASVTVVVVQVDPIDLVPPGMSQIAQDTIVVCVRDSVLLDAGHDSDPETTTYFWVTANKLDRYYKATTNGNWIDIQTHEVRVNYGGETDCETYGIITIIFDFNECAIDIPETSRDDGAVELFPNPNKGSFSLVMKRQVEDLQIRIFDMKGQEVFSDRKSGTLPEGYRNQFALPNAEKGIYIVHLSTEDFHTVKKMVVN